MIKTFYLSSLQQKVPFLNLPKGRFGKSFSSRYKKQKISVKNQSSLSGFFIRVLRLSGLEIKNPFKYP